MTALSEHDLYIGQRIREARLALRMSQKTLADMLGMSYQQLQKYENGSNRVNGAHFNRLVTALNRPVTWFFPNTTEVRNTPLFSAFLADKYGNEIASLWPQLLPPDRALIVHMVQRLAEQRHG